jgi:glycosyltransferase involved in cell wall biosynthesis
MNIWYLYHYAGGPGIAKLHRAYHLSRAWSKLGHRTTVFVARFHHMLDKPEPLPDTMNVDGVSYRSINARTYSGNGMGRILNMADYCLNVPKLASLVPSELDRPDAILVSSPQPYAIFPAYRLAKQYGAQLTFEVRDLWPLSITEIVGSSKNHPFILFTEFAERFAYRKSNLVASLLAGAEDYMRTRGLRPNKFVHVPNGIADEPVLWSEPVSSEGQKAKALIERWKQENRLILIHPGAQGLPNGLDRLVEAVSMLNNAGISKTFAVLLVGEGGMTESLKRQVQVLQTDNVALIGSVPNAEANWLTARCDIGYSGKRDDRNVYRYGTSFNKTASFMQMGIPILLPIYAPLDPVTLSGAGVVTGSDNPAEIAASLRSMLAMTPEQRSRMGAKGKAFALDNLNYQKIAVKYSEWIERTRPIGH